MRAMRLTTQSRFRKRLIGSWLAAGCACAIAVIVGLLTQTPMPTQSQRSGCFMILVGKAATADGSVMLAHNNDLTGDELSLIEKHPRASHAPGAMISFPSGLEIPQVTETYEWLVMRIAEGYAEGDAVAINEWQVAIAGGVALERDRNNRARRADPLVKSGLTGGVRYIALQRAKTARECVELVGELYSTYGVTYASGFGVADPNEIWYIESGGGRTWAAVRIPDDRYWVQANGYRIGHVDVADTANVLVSDGLIDFCRAHRLWDPAAGPFNFSEAVGGRYVHTPGKEFYNRRRVWRGMDLLTPSLGLHEESAAFPETAVPDEAVTLEGLFEILRDHYLGTPYDGYAGDGGRRPEERLIASPTCVHTSVIQLRAGFPADVGAVLWAGLSRPFGTVYLPFYLGIDAVPGPYSNSNAPAESAFVTYKRLSDIVLGDYPGKSSTVLDVWNEIEARCINGREEIDRRAIDLYEKEPGSAGRFLSDYVTRLSFEALFEAERLISEMMVAPPDRDTGARRDS